MLMIRSAAEYHVRTSYHRMDMNSHYLDWSGQPSVFKTYPGREAVSLSQNTVYSREKWSEVLERGCLSADESEMDFERLSRIVLVSHAITAKARFGGADFYYRSVASAGALYPFELYVAVVNVHGIENGVYHHDVASRALTLLRPGNAFADISEAITIEQDETPTTAFFLTSIFFRSSWKYRDRAYRYHLLDTGHLAENLSLALKSECLRFRLAYDFNDRTLNQLLGLDTSREVCLAVALVSGLRSPAHSNVVGLGEVAPDLAVCSKVAAREVDYPMIRQIHTASSTIVEPVGSLPHMLDELGLSVQSWTEVSRTGEPPESIGYADAVLTRRSMRNFVRNELPYDYFASFVKALCSDSMNDTGPNDKGSSCVQVGFLTGRVQGLNPGFYLLDSTNRSIGLVAEGFLMDEMAHVCLGQQWLMNTAINFLFLCNLEVLERTWGPRGYRYAMLYAGRLGQRIYIGATSMKIGCCGVGAFYDAEAVRLLRLNDKTKLLYLVAAGPVKKWSMGQDRV